MLCKILPHREPAGRVPFMKEKNPPGKQKLVISGAVQKKQKPPTGPVPMPIGISSRAMKVRTARSAQTCATPPIKAESGNSWAPTLPKRQDLNDRAQSLFTLAA
jgi:hypothetical protein